MCIRDSFITEMSTLIFEICEETGSATLAQVIDKLDGKVVKAELTKEDYQLLIDTLVNDGRLQEVVDPSATTPSFKPAKPIHRFNHFSSMPCGRCPVASDCRDGGIISPQTCVYMQQWLAPPEEEEDDEDDDEYDDAAGDGSAAMQLSYQD